MSELFYNFIINDLLKKYFESTQIAAGEKFYVMIEDQNQRQELCDAFEKSPCATTEEILFKEEEGFVNTAAPHTFTVMHCGNLKILISDCDSVNDGLQTKIRNSVGVEGTPISDMAALFILPGSNALETLLTAGHNLQDASFPLNVNEVVKAIDHSIETSTINKIEREYFRQYLEVLKDQKDYTSLLDFSHILSLLQRAHINDEFPQLDAFCDTEIYDDGFQISDADRKARVKENRAVFAKIAVCMSEAYEDDQRKQLSEILDPKMIKKIMQNPGDWKKISWAKIKESIRIKKENATLRCPKIEVVDNIPCVAHVDGNDKTSKTYLILCVQSDDLPIVKAVFNKNLKEFENGKSGAGTISNSKLVFKVDKDIVSGRIGDQKNHHEVIILKVRTHNIFKEIEGYFKIQKTTGKIILDVPDAVSKIKFGDGETEVVYDQVSPVSVATHQRFVFDVEAERDDQVEIPFVFNGVEVPICFKLHIEKTLPIEPSILTDSIWGAQETYKIDADLPEASSIVIGKNGPCFLHGRVHKLIAFERKMIDEKSLHLTIDKQFGSSNVSADKLDVPSFVSEFYNKIFDYYKTNRTTPSLDYPSEGLCKLISDFLTEFHKELDNIPTGRSLTGKESELSRIGIVECEDGSIMLSPFHPLLMAYMLEMRKSITPDEYNRKIVTELSPRNLMPYISYDDKAFNSVATADTENVFTWVNYVESGHVAECQGEKSVAKLVKDKLCEFMLHFRYYFPDKECPLVVSSIGMSDSGDLIRGLIAYILDAKDEMQHIDIHDYVVNVLEESFFERLNRTVSIDRIRDIFDRFNFNVKEEEVNDVVRLLFSRVSYYKHEYRESQALANYSHVVFYKIDTGSEFSTLPSNNLRVEAMLNGLVSMPSTGVDSNKRYLIGYGSSGIPAQTPQILTVANDMNSLYAGLYKGGLSPYCKGQCLAKVYSFNDAQFLESVYQQSTWVTFIDPNVDLNFFYKQDNLYVVHYVEQHSISAKLESITVTKHTDQYNQLLFNSIQKYKSVKGTSETFSRKMINYFNCLNGKWLLDIIRKQNVVIREKMSIVATCYVMEHFMKRAGDDIVWIPIALDEILRVTGAIGGKMSGIFSKEDLGIEGALSDDLLMMGLKQSDDGRIKVFFYPVEVKVLSDNSIDHGEKQVANLYTKVLREKLLSGNSFSRKVYRALLATHFLSNAEKMNANRLLSEADYKKIEASRYALLNVDFDIDEPIPDAMGQACLVVYSDSTPKSIYTSIVDGVKICHVNMMEEDCYKIVSNPDSDLLSFVTESSITHNAEIVCEDDVEGYEGDLTVSQMPEQTYADQVDSTLHTQTQDDAVSSNADSSVIMSDDNTLTDFETEDDPCIKIVLGNTPSGHQIVFEPNNTDAVNHPNMGIIGTMGTGKTQLARSIIAQFSKEALHNVGKKPIGMLVFDYKGDYYDQEFLTKVDGQSFLCNFPFNPLKLIVTSKNHGMKLPSVTADRISDSFAKAYNLGAVQQSAIKQVIVETYEEFGITGDPQTWDKPIPTMQNVIDKYFNGHDAKDSVYALFSKLSDYSIFTTNNTECVSLFEWLDGVKVIDLTPYPDDTKKVIVSLILDLFYEEMRQLGSSQLQGIYRELRAMVLVDEAHQFLKKDFNSFRNIISEGRSFGVGMILSTQNMADFKSSKMEYSQFILSWAIHHVNNITKAEIVNVFGSKDSNFQGYMDFISKAKKFESICKIGNEVHPIMDLPYYQLIQQDERFK